MRRAPAPSVDLSVYVQAIPLLVRNPVIIVVPLLMAVAGVLVGVILSASGGGGALGSINGGLGGLIVRLLELFGLGAACIMADEAWRHGKASFDRGWSEARRRGGDIFMTAIGMTFIFAIISYAGALLGFGFGLVGLGLTLLAMIFLIWAIPAASVGGIPGSAGISVSIERVRANPLPAVLAALVYVALTVFAVPYATLAVWSALAAYLAAAPIAGTLIGAVFQAIAIGYVALIVTKTYTDAAFTRRW